MGIETLYDAKQTLKDAFTTTLNKLMNNSLPSQIAWKNYAFRNISKLVTCLL